MKKRILLADDEVSILETTRRRLEHEGYEVTTATDGEEVLEEAFDFEEGGFDLILLDIKMPKLDGFQVVKRLRENPSTAKIPTILFTASSARWEALLAKCVELGITDFLKKPFQSKELVARIRHVLGEVTTHG